MDKVMVANIEKSAAVEQLQSAVKREKMLQEEISRVTIELQSSRAELGSIQQSIASLESRIKSKKYSINRLRREKDGCIEELEVERGRHRAIQERLALADAESASTKEEAELAKGVLSLAIENFKESQEYKDEIFEGGFAFYNVRYEDGRDAVRKLYPNLDLSSIVPSSSGEKVAEETTAPNKKDAPAVPEPAPTIEVVSEQGEEEADW